MALAIAASARALPATTLPLKQRSGFGSGQVRVGLATRAADGNTTCSCDFGDKTANCTGFGGSLTGALQGLARCSRTLETLSLEDNKLSGSIPSTISALTRLTYLSLRNNQLTGSIPQEVSALTNMV